MCSSDLPLQHEAVIQTERLDRLVAKNPEHLAMVTKLEQAYDSIAQPTLPLEPTPIRESDIPTPEELAAELEAFLRDGDADGR